MLIYAKYIGSITGILAVLLSFLFFGRRQEVYLLLLNSGIIISLICFLWILFGSGTIKAKMAWTGIFALGIILNWLTESYFIYASYRIYLAHHKNELAKVNEILKNKPGEIWILRDSISEKSGSTLSSAEKQALLQEKEKLGVYLILKSDSTIYYGLWGFLDVRLGLTYSLSDRLPNSQYHRLDGNWFH
jgi:hypothetical protein